MNPEVNITGVTLKTDRLVLRPFELRDLNDFYEYCKVPGVGEMAGWPYHKSIEDSLNIINIFIKNKNVFAITYNGKTIGSVGIEKYSEALFPEFRLKKAREIGYVLSKEYWGLGIMPEAVNAVIEYCFKELKLDLLVCGCYSFNTQSKRVQEKVGFIEYKPEPKHYSGIWNKDVDGVYSVLYNE